MARVLPVLGLAHLDRPFDYLIDVDQDEDAQCPGRPELTHPTRIVSVTPIADDFEDEIFAAYDAQYAA